MPRLSSVFALTVFASLALLPLACAERAAPDEAPVPSATPEPAAVPNAISSSAAPGGAPRLQRINGLHRPAIVKLPASVVSPTLATPRDAATD